MEIKQATTSQKVLQWSLLLVIILERKRVSTVNKVFYGAHFRTKVLLASVDKNPRYSGTDYSGTIQSLPLNTQL